MKEPNKSKKKRNTPIINNKTGVVYFNKQVVCSRNIILPTCTIDSGEPFFLKDAYIEYGTIVIGIEVGSSIQEAVFKSENNRVNNINDIIPFVEAITC